MKETNLYPSWLNHPFLIFLGILFLLLTLASLQEPGVVSAVFSVTALILLGIAAFERYRWQFVIGNNRVSSHRGIISRNQQSVKLENLRAVELEQGVLKRLFGIGDLKFYSAGHAGVEVVFHGIKNPIYWRDEVDKMSDSKKTG